MVRAGHTVTAAGGSGSGVLGRFFERHPGWTGALFLLLAVLLWAIFAPWPKDMVALFGRKKIFLNALFNGITLGALYFLVASGFTPIFDIERRKVFEEADIGREQALDAVRIERRRLHEALRRRCVYHWIDWPDPQLEAQIVTMRASRVARATAEAVVALVNRLRQEPLAKPPGVSETVEWAEAATLLERQGHRGRETFRRSIGVAVKDHDDLAHLEARLDDILRAGEPR